MSKNIRALSHRQGLDDNLFRDLKQDALNGSDFESTANRARLSASVLAGADAAAVAARVEAGQTESLADPSGSQAWELLP